MTPTKFLRTKRSPLIILAVSVVVLTWIARRSLIEDDHGVWHTGENVCDHATQNIQEVQDAADELGLELVLVEPQLLDAIENGERARAEQVKNFTHNYGKAKVVKQPEGDVYSWSDQRLTVDFSLPLAMYFPKGEVFCHKQRASFALFKEDGSITKDGKPIGSKDHLLRHLEIKLSTSGFESYFYRGPDPRLAIPGIGLLSDPILWHVRFTRRHHSIYVTLLYERTPQIWWHAAVEGQNRQKSPVHFGAHAGSWRRFPLRKVAVDIGLTLFVPANISNFLEQLPHSRHVECNVAKAELFIRKYGLDQSAAALDFYEKAKLVLATGKRVLDRIGVPFWLSSGTCLGWFRQCGIIVHSKDVDFGVQIKHYRPEIVPEMVKEGFHLKHRFGKLSDSFELSFFRNNTKLDFFFFYEEEDHMWNGGTQARTGKKFKYIFPKFRLCWTSFLDEHVRVPCTALAYIEANYGLEWGTPVYEWNWKASPPNVRENGRWNEADWKDVIQVFDV